MNRRKERNKKRPEERHGRMVYLVEDKTMIELDEKLDKITYLCENTNDYVIRIMRHYPDARYPATFYRKNLKWVFIAPYIISIFAVIIAVISIVIG